MTREEILQLLNECFAEAIKDNKQQRENYLKRNELTGLRRKH